MTNLSHIFPSGYLNIPTEEDLRFEVQDMLRYAYTDKQIMDQLRAIRCPYMRKAMALCLSMLDFYVDQMKRQLLF